MTLELGIYSPRPRTVGTWQELTREFLKEFLSVLRTNTLRKFFLTFSQKDSETFYQVWKGSRTYCLLVHVMVMKHGESLNSSMMG